MSLTRAGVIRLRAAIYGDTAGCPCQTEATRCRHYEKCRDKVLACPAFRMWACRITKAKYRDYSDEELRTPTKIDYLRTFRDNREEEDLEDYLYAVENQKGKARRADARVLQERAEEDPLDGGGAEQGGKDPQLGAAMVLVHQAQ